MGGQVMIRARGTQPVDLPTSIEVVIFVLRHEIILQAKHYEIRSLPKLVIKVSIVSQSGSVTEFRHERSSDPAF
jgi:hypothetical protein